MKTSEEKSKIIENVRKRVGEGLTIQQACKAEGLRVWTYYAWAKKGKKPKATAGKRRANKKAKTVAAAAKLLTIPVQTSAAPLIVIMGSPADVSAALDRLAVIHGGAR